MTRSEIITLAAAGVVAIGLIVHAVFPRYEWRVIGDSDHWLLEDLFYEKVTILDALGLNDAALAACEAGLDRCPGSPLLRGALAVGSRLGLTRYGPEQTMFLQYRPVLANDRLKTVFGYIPTRTSREAFDDWRAARRSY